MRQRFQFQIDIIEFLKQRGVLQTRDERKAALDLAALDANLRSQLEIDGPTQQFLVNTITLAMGYGLLEREQDALAAILNAIKTWLGPADQASVDRFAEEWQLLRETATLYTIPESVRVVPKGLRPFDRTDKNFFLRLLPPPCDENGIPEVISFWKNRIEGVVPEPAFRVGLIYGPSGCGKSSLIEAGLLPLLHERVTTIVVRAEENTTESVLLKALQQQVPELATVVDLESAILELIRLAGSQAARKFLVVIDQFEQWLQGHRASGTELVHALRHCDGAGLQCLLLVRDDFLAPAFYFLNELEVQHEEDVNIRVVKPFELLHAREVLQFLGLGYKTLQTVDDGALSREQNTFLDQAVYELAEDGKINCVRLTVFALMMEGKPWIPATLRGMGGLDGIGRQFLEERLGQSTIFGNNRIHRRAAINVLEALLPTSGTLHVKVPESAVKAAAACQSDEEFRAVVRILDASSRLITAAEAGLDEAGQPRGEIRYRLAHDFLVPTVRDWLDVEKRKTIWGRATADMLRRAGFWNQTQALRDLPSPWEFVEFSFLTRAWSSHLPMMARAAGIYGLAIAWIVGGFWQAREWSWRTWAQGKVATLVRADLDAWKGVMDELTPHWDYAEPYLRAHASAENGHEVRVRANMALARVDESATEYLVNELHTQLEPAALLAILTVLEPRSKDVQQWVQHADEKDNQVRQINSACALARHTPAQGPWSPKSDTCSSISKNVVNRISETPRDFAILMSLLEPVRQHLVMPIGDIVLDESCTVAQREAALNIFLEFARDDGKPIAHLLAGGNDVQFDKAYSLIGNRVTKTDTIEALAAELNHDLGDGKSQSERPYRRKAQAAIALIKLGEPAVSTCQGLISRDGDPRAASYFIHRAAALKIDSEDLAQAFLQLQSTPASATDVRVKQTLLHALGQLPEPKAERERVKDELIKIYGSPGDHGLRASAEWLLRRWGEADRVVDVLGKLEQSPVHLQDLLAQPSRRWYLTKDKHCLVVISPASFQMGSPAAEPRRTAAQESIQTFEIKSAFAIAATETTRMQYQRFLESTTTKSEVEKYLAMAGRSSFTDDSPAVYVNWFDAARYCNWLSDREGLPETQWCYQVSGEDTDANIQLKPDFAGLQGFRLPTEAEWEFACRAQTKTIRHFGNADELAVHYGLFDANSDDHAWPVATRLPNQFGLFDMYGNVEEWCCEQFNSKYDGTFNQRPITKETDCSIRGGSWFYQPFHLRSAKRDRRAAFNRLGIRGFRVAQTVPK